MTCQNAVTALHGLFALLIVLQMGLAPATYADDQPVGDTSIASAEAEVEDQTPPLVRTAARIIIQMGALQEEVRDLNKRIKTASPSDELVIDRQIVVAKLEFVELMDKLLKTLEQQQTGEIRSPASSEQREFAEITAVEMTESIIRHIVNNEKVVVAIRRNRDRAVIADRLEIEQLLAREVTWLDALYAAYFDNMNHLTMLGLDSSWARADLSERLSERARLQAARIAFTLEQIQEIAERAASQPDDADIGVEQASFEARRTMLIESLGRLVKHMGALELDASAYQQLLITSTGEVTADIFERGVAIGLVEGWLESLGEWMNDRGQAVLFNALVFILIISIAWLISGITRVVLNVFYRTSGMQSSLLLRTMIVGMIPNSILLAGILIGLSQAGVELGAMLAGLGIAGFIVGFALQDSLGNFASGMMILSYRPFDVGDVIDAADVLGTVNAMSLVNTTILTYDNRTMIVPNSKLWGGVITNLTNQEIRRVDVEVRIPYSEDVERVVEVLSGALQGDDRILDDPAPNVRLHELGENSMRFIVRPWTKTDDYWNVYWDVTRSVKGHLDEAGIRIAVPERSVRLQSDAAT
jgi:small conductance mechanosensitive channel